MNRGDDTGRPRNVSSVAGDPRGSSGAVHEQPAKLGHATRVHHRTKPGRSSKPAPSSGSSRARRIGAAAEETPSPRRSNGAGRPTKRAPAVIVPRMKRILYVQPFSGLSGDMMLGAL